MFFGGVPPGRVTVTDSQSPTSVADVLFFPTRVAAGLAAESLNRRETIAIPQTVEQLTNAAAAWALRGKDIEAETFDTILALLPEQAQGLLQPFRSEASRFASGNQPMAIDVAPLAPSTTGDFRNFSAKDPTTLVTNQIAAELASVKSSVTLVNETAQALLIATNAAEEPMLQLNLRDARTILQKRMEQLSNSSSSGITAQAVDDAVLLLTELELML